MEEVVRYMQENPIELVGAVTGVTCVWLMSKEKTAGWPLGLVSVACYVYVFGRAGLYGDFFLYLVFAALNAYGWYRWTIGRKDAEPLPVSLLPASVWPGSIAGIAAGTALIGFASAQVPGANLPYLNAFTTSVSLLAQWWLARKKLQNWLLWIFADLIYVAMYLYMGLYLTALLFVLYLLIAINGYRHWRISMLLSRER